MTQRLKLLGTLLTTVLLGASVEHDEEVQKPWRSPGWRYSALNWLAVRLPPLQKAKGPRRKCPF